MYFNKDLLHYTMAALVHFGTDLCCLHIYTVKASWDELSHVYLAL